MTTTFTKDIAYPGLAVISYDFCKFAFTFLKLEVLLLFNRGQFGQ